MYKLVIEVNRETDAALRRLAELENVEGVEQLNKTTVANRAIQVWRDIRNHWATGGEVYFRDPATGRFTRVRWEP